jgi:hypothetical protein
MLGCLWPVLSRFLEANPVEIAMRVHAWIFAASFIGFSVYALYRFFKFLLSSKESK